jgi:hypothetical protein
LRNQSNKLVVRLSTAAYISDAAGWQKKKLLTTKLGQDSGAILLLQFSAIFDNFLRKNWRSSLGRTNVMIKFLHNLA